MNDPFVRLGNIERGEKTAAVLEPKLDPKTLGVEKPGEVFSILRSHPRLLVLVLVIDPSALAITSTSMSTNTKTARRAMLKISMRRGEAGKELRELRAQGLAVHNEIDQPVFHRNSAV